MKYKSKNFKILYLFIILLMLAKTGFTQGNEAKAKAYYFSAETSFQNKNYTEALELLDKSEAAARSSNAYI